MARIKKEVEAVATQPEEVVEAVQEAQETEAGTAVEAVTEVEPEIPEYAHRILKTHNQYPELYISSKGGAYPVYAKPADNVSTILYKNPYYKF